MASSSLAHEINMIFNEGLIFTPEVFIQCKKVSEPGSMGQRPLILI